LAWLLALPFLYLSRPTPTFLVIGTLVSLSGLFLRAFAAGSIHKDRELATGGPYRFIRHPLYFGSFLLGLGLALAGGRWWLPVLFVGLFVWLYGRAIEAEERELESQFGEEFARYRGRVPAFLPRVHVRRSTASSPGFRSWLYWRNKEWQAALGTVIGFGLLWARMHFLG
jgi:protein-S-isoprenylcysteine O-methyltransferase Ste14